MNSFWNTRRVIYGLVILISAIVVFCVGNFRKWLDVSGGTRLTYRISYDNYEQTYSGSDHAQDLANIKKTVQDIILKNIDGRISNLWVSNYRSYTQSFNNENQIVVEIWWITDLDQAKEIIWKTVELEFKLPNDSEWSEKEKSERTTLAQKLYNDLSTNTDKFEAIAGSRESENILYNKYDKVTISQLPAIYQENLWVLEETQEWKVSPLMEWKYAISYDVDGSGNVQYADVNGYTFFRMISKETWVREGVSLNDIVEVASSLWITYNGELTPIKTATDIASWAYAIEWNVLKYNNWEIYPNEEAYDLRVLAMIPDTTEEENVESNEENNEANSDENAFSNKVNDAKSDLLADMEAEITDASPVLDGVISVNELKNGIPSFDSSNTDAVQVYELGWITYLIAIRDAKSASDHWYDFAIVNGVDEGKFNSALESQTFYTMEEVFVQDRLSWKNAQSSDGKILNGANFEYAAVSTSQMWEPVVLINFDDTGKEIFCNITTNNIWKQMAIFIWGQLITSPVIQAKICDGSAQIDGNFTPDSAKELTSQLNEWALPAPLILMQEEKVSPTLWEYALNWALLAMAIGFIAIWLYMSFAYGWKKWFISLISLSVYTLVLFAIVKIINYALSLSGIAAVILSIWMAVDANVLIFERMKEEKENKKSDSEAINIAYDRSWNAIRDWQISTWMIGLLLWLMWVSMFKGFGTMLVVWVFLTLLVNAPIIKELLHIFYRKK